MDKVEKKVEGLLETINILENERVEKVPLRAAIALTKMATGIRDALVQNMKQVFDRPTPYTLNSIFVKSAKKDDLRAEVMIKDYATKGTAPIKFLRPEVYGGPRNQKRSESLLSRIGILESGEYLMPWKAPLNQYGNVSPGIIQRVLSGLQATSTGDQDSPLPGQGYRGTRAGRKVPRRYFTRRLPDGKVIIFERTSKATTPLFASRRRANYKPIFKFYEVVESDYGAAQATLRKALERFGW